MAISLLAPERGFGNAGVFGLTAGHFLPGTAPLRGLSAPCAAPDAAVQPRRSDLAVDQFDFMSGDMAPEEMMEAEDTAPQPLWRLFEVMEAEDDTPAAPPKRHAFDLEASQSGDDDDDWKRRNPMWHLAAVGEGGLLI